jgi:hypothetical protein
MIKRAFGSRAKRTRRSPTRSRYSGGFGAPHVSMTDRREEVQRLQHPAAGLPVESIDSPTGPAAVEHCSLPDSGAIRCPRRTPRCGTARRGGRVVAAHAQVTARSCFPRIDLQVTVPFPRRGSVAVHRVPLPATATPRRAQRANHHLDTHSTAFAAAGREWGAAATTTPRRRRLDLRAGRRLRPALAPRLARRRLAMTAPRWVIPALVVVAVALVAAAERLASSGPLGFAAAAALLLGAPALVAGLSRRTLSSRT